MPKTTKLDNTQFTQTHSAAYQQLVADASTRVQTGRLRLSPNLNKLELPLNKPFSSLATILSPFFI